MTLQPDPPPPVCAANVILNVANQPSFFGSGPTLSQLVSMGLVAAKQDGRLFRPIIDNNKLCLTLFENTQSWSTVPKGQNVSQYAFFRLRWIQTN